MYHETFEAKCSFEISGVFKQLKLKENFKKKPIVFFVCTGLGRINRGYESFAMECFNAIKDDNQFDLYLLKGGGKKAGREIVISNMHRKSRVAKFLGKVFNEEAYIIEQFTFCISLFPLILKRKPSVIYYSDFIAGTYLFHLRRIFKFKYKLLFSNGAPNDPPYKTEDHVQQLLPVYLENAIKRGETASKQTLLPYGFQISIHDQVTQLSQRERIRHQFGFSNSQQIILSVGAINSHHKRMDYIINEVAKMPEQYFLVLLGQYEAETKILKKLAELKLPKRHLIANVPYENVKDYYIMSDFFVLASLREGFGRVIVEALSYGLPCILHDYINARQVLQQYGKFINMQIPGELATCIIENENQVDKHSLILAAYNIYSWDKLKDQYAKMIAGQIATS